MELKDLHVSDRIKLAREGKHLDELTFDKDCRVRAEVAKQDHNIILYLKNDVSKVVRIQVAKLKKYNHYMVDDEDIDVRRAVAESGTHNFKLAHDKDWSVRFLIAKHGTHGHILNFDVDEDVRKISLKYSNKQQ